MTAITTRARGPAPPSLLPLPTAVEERLPWVPSGDQPRRSPVADEIVQRPQEAAVSRAPRSSSPPAVEAPIPWWAVISFPVVTVLSILLALAWGARWNRTSFENELQSIIGQLESIETDLASRPVDVAASTVSPDGGLAVVVDVMTEVEELIRANAAKLEVIEEALRAQRDDGAERLPATEDAVEASADGERTLGESSPADQEGEVPNLGASSQPPADESPSEPAEGSEADEMEASDDEPSGS